MSLIVSVASSEKELEDIFKLRYKVLCLEWEFERHENYPDGLVTDAFDSNAIHIAVRDRSTQKVYGAVSLILDSSAGFPTEKHCELDINSEEIPRNSLAEISRLVIHRDFRRRSEDKYIYGPDEDRRSIGSFNYQQNYRGYVTHYKRTEDRGRPQSRRSGDNHNDQRRRHELILNLYKGIYMESKKRQISHWYSIMTKGVVNLLDRFGLIFDAIGDPVDYNGIRTPYLGVISKIEEEMSEKHPELYEEFTKAL